MTASIIKTLQQIFDNVDIYPNFEPVGQYEFVNLSALASNGVSRVIQSNLFTGVESLPFVADALNAQHFCKWQFSTNDTAIIRTDNYMPLEFYNAWISEQVSWRIDKSTDWDVLSS